MQLGCQHQGTPVVFIVMDVLESRLQKKQEWRLMSGLVSVIQFTSASVRLIILISNRLGFLPSRYSSSSLRRTADSIILISYGCYCAPDEVRLKEEAAGAAHISRSHPSRRDWVALRAFCASSSNRMLRRLVGGFDNPADTYRSNQQGKCKAFGSIVNSTFHKDNHMFGKYASHDVSNILRCAAENFQRLIIAGSTVS